MIAARSFAFLTNKLCKVALGARIGNGSFVRETAIHAQFSQRPQSIRHSDILTTTNDPYFEHDFGSIQFGESTIFWKIDYYDIDLQMHSPDPSDPAVTTRILTIMLAEEY